MNEENYYLIKDFNFFVKETKKVAVENFKTFVEEKDVKEEYDEVTNKITNEFIEISSKADLSLEEINNEIISDHECEVLMYPMIEHKEGKMIVSEGMYFDILKCIHTRIISNTLAILASKGIIESAFDEELDDFVFWIS